MVGNLFLDTNIIIALFAQEEAVVQELGRAGMVHVSTVVMGELYYGAWRSTRVTSNLGLLAELARSVRVVSVDMETAGHYGEIKAKLRSKGRPIPENDIWVAAAALRWDLPLVTRDDHFREVEGLTLLQW